MLFKEIIGQREIKNKLTQLVTDQRIGHAQMFFGSEGYGSLALAIAFAQFVCCEDRRNGDSCGCCRSCRKFEKLQHPDLHFVYPVAVVKKTKDASDAKNESDRHAKRKEKEAVSDDFISQWRECLIESPYIKPFQWYEKIGIDNKQGAISQNESRQIIQKLSLKTFESPYKIMIVWRPEKMNNTAANKLLKILEEPPSNTLFHLVTDDTAQMLPTIVSRTQIVKIPRIDKNSMAAALKERLGLADQHEIDNIAHIADGDYQKALSFIETNEENEFFFNNFVKIMRLCYAVDIAGLRDWVDEMATLGRETQKHFLQYAIRMIRENFMLNLKANDIVYLSSKEKDFSANFSRFVNTGNVLPIAEELNKACVHIENNAYDKIVLFDMVLKITRLLKA